VRDADPFPDGRTAVAVRNRFGASQLVDVDLASGNVAPRTEASIDVVESHPRVSPDGAHIAHVAHRTGRWTLYVDDTPKPLEGDAATPEWIGDDLVLTIFAGGFAELHSLAKGTLTHTRGGAFQAAPAGDGRMFFMSLDPDGYVVRVLTPGTAGVPPAGAAASPPLSLGAARTPPGQPARTPAVPSRAPLELYWFAGGHAAPGDRALELGLRLGDVLGRLDTILAGSTNGGAALASVWRGLPIELGAHAFHTRDRDGVELRAHYDRYFPKSRLWLDAGALSDQYAFASASFTTRQVLATTRFDEGLRVDLDDGHSRGIASLGYRSSALHVTARYQHDQGEDVFLGGIASSILPRSAYARSILDPALPVAILSGRRYDGWRIETSVPSMPFTAFYQRHDLDGSSLSLAGARFELGSDPNPILKLPGVDLTVGVAYIFDEPLRHDTQWWLGVRWHP
jgi:hypothetical protein